MQYPGYYTSGDLIAHTSSSLLFAPKLGHIPMSEPISVAPRLGWLDGFNIGQWLHSKLLEVQSGLSTGHGIKGVSMGIIIRASWLRG